MKKVHVLSKGGGRTRCRYSSRPSRKVRAMTEADFLEQPENVQCSECRKDVAPHGVIRAQVAPGKWANIPRRDDDARAV